MNNLLNLTASGATATVSPYGAQVMSYLPRAGATDILWQSTPAHLTKAIQNHKPLRGGIPICWPWFVAHPSISAAPSHGFARISLWQVTAQNPSSVTLQLSTDGTNPHFPHPATATMQVTLTSQHLQLTLTTTNTGQTALPLTCALHTYLAVSHLSHSHIHGLAGLPHRGLLTNSQHPLRIAQETDATFHSENGLPPLTLRDAHTNRTTTLTYQAPDCILWNPGAQKAALLDMPPTAYQHFICLEGGHVWAPHQLGAGQAHTLSLTLTSA